MIETHPFEPFVDEETTLMIMGTFPPPRSRWCMDFYYPNRINDFWYMMGLIFFNDRNALYDASKKTFKLEEIKRLLSEHHIGLNDTGYKIERLKGNASDKFLEILEPIPLAQLLEKYPKINTLCTTGEKAAKVISELTSTPVPKMGEKVTSEDGFTIWRMPSTSRAYPMALAEKAKYYAHMYRESGIVC